MGNNGQKLSISLFVLYSYILLIEGNNEHQKKLFVFGDSYVDTGNTRMSLSSSWKPPYGITFPGKPSGRWSDGHIFTDFLARFMGLRTPFTYRLRKYVPKNKLKYGMNFAFGGTGVFDTLAPYPNMSAQIDFFEQLMHNNVFSPRDVRNSVALVSVSGNDYTAYINRTGSIQGLQNFIPQVVNQQVLDIERLHKLGVKKIAVVTIEPSGCLPAFTFTNGFQECNSTVNKLFSFHNLLLQQAVAQLNNQTRHMGRGSPFIVLDLYNAFLSVIKQQDSRLPGKMKFDNPLKPCCMGVNQNFYCGSKDEMGNKMYTVCEDPESYFFWDILHPTQAGWHAISSVLQTTFKELI